MFRKCITLLAATCLGVAAAVVGATPAHAETRSTIRPTHSNFCLDVTGGSNDNYALIQQWECNGNGQQYWYLRKIQGESYKIVSSKSGKCLDLRDGNLRNGALVQQWTCVDGSYHQMWQLTWDYSLGSYRIKSDLSQKCLDVTNASKANGALLQMWTCATPGTLHQRFVLSFPL